MERDDVISAVCASECFKSESACLASAGYEVADRLRLFKRIENDKVRLMFPTRVTRVEEGVVVALVCLFDLVNKRNVYAHAIFAGPTVNSALRSLFVPATQAKPQPGMQGNKAILKFISWKQAGWTRFVNDELEFGIERASTIWLNSFWKALDRMYGGDNLLGDSA